MRRRPPWRSREPTPNRCRCAAARSRPTQQQQAAAAAQRAKADVRLAYTEIHAPIDGIVDVRAALPARSSLPGSRW